jgi:hypothetical protein
MKKTGEVAIERINPKRARVFIEGDSDLVLNKMCARCERMLMSEDRKKTKQIPNVWEDIITAIRWRDKLPFTDEEGYTECTEEMMYKLLDENAPCITAFGLKKSFGQAVVRNNIDTYATKFDNSIVIPGETRGLIPIKFAEWKVDERLMSPQKGSPVIARLNHFAGWRADFVINYTDHVYNLNEIVNIINLAGFGLGIGSGRSSGYGRYHVVDVQ